MAGRSEKFRSSGSHTMFGCCDAKDARAQPSTNWQVPVVSYPQHSTHSIAAEPLPFERVMTQEKTEIIIQDAVREHISPTSRAPVQEPPQSICVLQRASFVETDKEHDTKDIVFQWDICKVSF